MRHCTSNTEEASTCLIWKSIPGQMKRRRTEPDEAQAEGAGMAELEQCMVELVGERGPHKTC